MPRGLILHRPRYRCFSVMRLKRRRCGGKHAPARRAAVGAVERAVGRADATFTHMGGNEVGTNAVIA
jgi:hypothetical protein